ncbi:MAG: SDR family oxidoreductase [Pirellulales bacterium]|nr:SDR family oxidoreductase [Pirellulales bacterium]
MRILITGCSRGLGRALLEPFISLGHTVAGCARDEGVIAQLTRQYPAPHLFAAVDVTSDAAVAAFARQVLDAGPVDLLINNAALMNTPASLWEVSAGEFDTLMAVNVNGVANVIRHVVPAMVARQSGVIVNLSSGWGRGVSPRVAPYCASKYAIEGLTAALALELPRGMAAVPLNPGVIHTDMLRQAWADDAARYPSPDNWAARAVPFLLQLGAKDNGQPLSVPG